jgi:AcrR family transcriptional regulator
MTQAERVALSDRRMFNATTLLIHERGTHNTTLRDVGEKAGYSRALAGARFGSKNDLFKELMAVFDQRWNEECRAFIGQRTGLAAFQASFDALVHFVTENTDYVRAMFILRYEMIGSSDAMRTRLSELHEMQKLEVQRWIREAIEDGSAKSNVVPERIAMQHSSFYFGLMYQWLVNPKKTDVKRAAHDFRGIILSSISKQTTTAKVKH